MPPFSPPSGFVRCSFTFGACLVDGREEGTNNARCSACSLWYTVPRRPCFPSVSSCGPLFSMLFCFPPPYIHSPWSRRPSEIHPGSSRLFPSPPSWNPAGFLLFSLLTAFRIYFRLVPSDYFVPTRVPRSRYGPSNQQGSGKLRPILAMIGRGFLESPVPNRFFKSF